jgi:hypothetical protein
VHLQSLRIAGNEHLNVRPDKLLSGLSELKVLAVMADGQPPTTLDLGSLSPDPVLVLVSDSSIDLQRIDDVGFLGRSSRSGGQIMDFELRPDRVGSQVALNISTWQSNLDQIAAWPSLVEAFIFDTKGLEAEKIGTALAEKRRKLGLASVKFTRK